MSKQQSLGKEEQDYLIADEVGFGDSLLESGLEDRGFWIVLGVGMPLVIWFNVPFLAAAMIGVLAAAIIQGTVGMVHYFRRRKQLDSLPVIPRPAHKSIEMLRDLRREAESEADGLVNCPFEITSAINGLIKVENALIWEMSKIDLDTKKEEKKLVKEITKLPLEKAADVLDLVRDEVTREKEGRFRRAKKDAEESLTLNEALANVDQTLDEAKLRTESERKARAELEGLF